MSGEGQDREAVRGAVPATNGGRPLKARDLTTSPARHSSSRRPTSSATRPRPPTGSGPSDFATLEATQAGAGTAFPRRSTASRGPWWPGSPAPPCARATSRPGSTRAGGLWARPGHRRPPPAAAPRGCSPRLLPAAAPRGCSPTTARAPSPGTSRSGCRTRARPPSGAPALPRHPQTQGRAGSSAGTRRSRPFVGDTTPPGSSPDPPHLARSPRPAGGSRASRSAPSSSAPAAPAPTRASPTPPRPAPASAAAGPASPSGPGSSARPWPGAARTTTHAPPEPHPQMDPDPAPPSRPARLGSSDDGQLRDRVRRMRASPARRGRAGSSVCRLPVRSDLWSPIPPPS